jgi:hypothetical protein
MNNIFTITEEEKRRIIGMHQIATKNHYIMEKYEGGLIMAGDDLCEIECERKIAAYGSNGDVVKEIQHALSKCGYNTKYEGGGMKQGCGEDKKNCDGKFREHTRDSVKEFQRENGLTVDGKVGSDTLKKLVSEGCLDDPECDCEEQEFKQDDTKKDYVKQFDCEEVIHCMQKYLFRTTAPDYSGFMECILNNARKDNDKTDYYGDTKLNCNDCLKQFPNKYVNKMPLGVDDPQLKAEITRKRAFGDWCINNCDGFKAAM